MRAQAWATRLWKACGRRTAAAELQRSSLRSVESNRISCRAGGAWQPSMMPSAEWGCIAWDKATRVLTRRRIAATATAQQLSLVARMCRAFLRHRRGSKAGRYYRERHRSPNVLNLEKLWLPTTCSASKKSSVAEVRSQLGRPAAARTARDHRVGAVRAADRFSLFAIVSK